MAAVDPSHPSLQKPASTAVGRTNVLCSPNSNALRQLSWTPRPFTRTPRPLLDKDFGSPRVSIDSGQACSTSDTWKVIVVICSLVEVGFNFVLLGGGSQSITRIMRMARMTRLGRVLRVARIVRFVKELRVLVISIMSTLQTLLWALFLLLIIIYMFAVLLVQATTEYFSEDPAFNRKSLVGLEERLENLNHYWGSLQASMYTLFMAISGGFNWETAVFAIAEVHWIWASLFTCFIAFASFALINVMTAVFCQSAIETAQKNMDVKWQKMCSDKRKHIEILKRLFKSLDNNTKGTISMSKLERCWDSEAMLSFRNSMDLDPDDFWTFFTVLDKQDKDVSAADFVDGCLRLKGQAKAFDMAVMTHELRHLSSQNVRFMNQMQEGMQILLLQLVGEDLPIYQSQDGPGSPLRAN